MHNEERRTTGRLYDPGDPEILAKQAKALDDIYEYNQTRPAQEELRQSLLRKIFAEVGDGCHVEPPLRANWGANTHLGDSVYVNFNLTLVDDTDIYIGSHTMIAPNVVIDAATHPISPELRKRGLQYNLPVRIGENVWIGAGAIILPGVAIGDNAVIGAGSVVTHDIPANVVAVGSPCRVLREIGEEDRQYDRHGMKIDVPEEQEEGRTCTEEEDCAPHPCRGR